jgi:hypothetical protein
MWSLLTPKAVGTLSSRFIISCSSSLELFLDLSSLTKITYPADGWAFLGVTVYPVEHSPYFLLVLGETDFLPSDLILSSLD